MPKEPPAHLSEAVFRKFERVLGEVLAKWPQTVEFDPVPLRATTFAARLRDAIRSFITYGWNSPLDLEKLKEVRRRLHVRVEGSIVVVQTVAGMPTVAPVIAGSREMSNVDITCFAHLLHRGHILGPVSIRGWKLEAVQNLVAKFDVSLSQENEEIIML